MYELSCEEPELFEFGELAIVITYILSPQVTGVYLVYYLVLAVRLHLRQGQGQIEKGSSMGCDDDDNNRLLLVRRLSATA